MMILFILGESRGQGLTHILPSEAIGLSYLGALFRKWSGFSENDPGFCSMMSISSLVKGMWAEQGLQREVGDCRFWSSSENSRALAIFFEIVG